MSGVSDKKAASSRDGSTAVAINRVPWPRVPLAELCNIEAPIVDPRSSDFRDLPHVSGENIESGSGRLLSVRTAAEDRVKSGKYLFDGGVLLYSKLRPYLRKVAIADFRGLCSADMYPVQFDRRRVDLHFAKYALLAEEFSRYAVRESERARMPKLNREQLLRFEFALPPLSEQERIASRLKVQMATIERARAAAAERLAAAQALAAAYLREVFEGPEAIGSGGWPRVTVGSVCTLVNGDAYKELDWSHAGARIIRIQNLNDHEKPFNHWSGPLDDLVRVKSGDVLLAWSGTPGTSFGAHLWERGDGVLNQHIFRVDLDLDRCDPLWFVHAVNHALDELIDAASGAVGLRHVTKGEVQSLGIPLPALREQKRRMADLSRRLAEAQRLTGKIEDELAAIAALPAALLREAFQGNQ